MNNKLLKKYINDFQKNKIALIKYWVKNKEVLKLFKKYDIQIKFFIKEYAVDILEYYIKCIDEEKECENTKAIDNLMNFTKAKDISSSELFILFNALKNSLLEFAYDLKIVNFQIQKELNLIFEKNFSLILEKYKKLREEYKEELLKSSSIVDKYVIVSRTDTKGKILNISEAFCKIAGYKKEELIGKPHSTLRHPDTPVSLFKDLWETISNGQHWQGQIKNKKKDKGIYWIDVIITPIFDDEKNIICYDAIGQDITSKKELEEHQAIIIEQSKSAAMGEMISMIAHQWRQPLHTVSVLIQKLPITKSIDGSISDELLNQVVSDVSTQLDYMSNTIDDFRDFFLPDKPKEKVLADVIINKALDFVSLMLKTDDVQIDINIQTDTKINVHVNELVQVLINLFKNARDAMVEKKIEEKELNITTYEKYNYVVIEVEDNAGGIQKELINKIFEPYFSTKDEKNGTGLGLYMCKTIIEKHSKGFLSVKNSTKGAKFQIKLPVS